MSTELDTLDDERQELADEPAAAGRIQFRCPHRPWSVPGDKSRAEKAQARRTLYDVPDDAEWVRVDHDYDPGKTQRRRVNGRLVTVKPYAHELGHRWEAVVTCPDCGDEVSISTDQTPPSEA